MVIENEDIDTWHSSIINKETYIAFLAFNNLISACRSLILVQEKIYLSFLANEDCLSTSNNERIWSNHTNLKLISRFCLFFNTLITGQILLCKLKYFNLIILKWDWFENSVRIQKYQSFIKCNQLNSILLKNQYIKLDT